MNGTLKLPERLIGVNEPQRPVPGAEPRPSSSDPRACANCTCVEVAVAGVIGVDVVLESGVRGPKLGL